MFADSTKQLALSNTNFRRVLYTGKHSQLVAMRLLGGEDIGAETHANSDQIFLFVAGNGEVMVAGESRTVAENDLVFVPAETEHNVTNTGDEDLKLLTIYALPAHPDGTVQATKQG